MASHSYPFPLPVNSSHHSLYHRFLLGAQAEVLSPLPKPCCSGKLTQQLPAFCEGLTLHKWQKLYNGSFPWAGVHPPSAYEPSNVAPHRPLPSDYARPPRTFGAFDFVQIADPSVSALALIGGDLRVLRGFMGLNHSLCTQIEKSVATQRTPRTDPSVTGRGLFGHFVEPSNRWLMPCLHAHSRLLNFTSHACAPRRFHPVDHDEIALAGRRAKAQWLSSQAALLTSLGYEATVREESPRGLWVDGVDARILATIDAPRLAVLRMLESLMGPDPWRGLVDPSSPSTKPLLACMMDHLERSVRESVSYFRPPKLPLPMEGPWRESVSRHLQDHCPVDFARMRATANTAQGKSVLGDLAHDASVTMIAASADDPCHMHALGVEAHDAAPQRPADADLNSWYYDTVPIPGPSLWLSRAFAEAYADVRMEIFGLKRSGKGLEGQATLRLCEQAEGYVGLEEARRETRALTTTIERNNRQLGYDAAATPPGPAPKTPPRILEELSFCGPNQARTLVVEERSRGGRSL